MDSKPNILDGEVLKDRTIPDIKLEKSYITDDGSKAFINPVKGVDPEDAQDLATKAYVDSQVGGSGASLTILDATGAIDGSNTHFSFIKSPLLIIVDGQIKKKTTGYTQSGVNITFTNGNIPQTDSEVWGLG